LAAARAWQARFYVASKNAGDGRDSGQEESSRTATLGTFIALQDTADGGRVRGGDRLAFGFLAFCIINREAQ
jgi:hypothetical protein